MVHLYSSSYIVHLHSSLAQYSTHKADTTKNCEQFYFRLFSQVQKLHSYTCTLIKAPPPLRPPCLQSGPPKAVVNWLQKFTQLHLFLLFLAYCCVRFLTLINNSSIFQRTNLKNLCPVRFCCFGGFIGVSGCKVTKSKPHIQNNLVKKP